MPSAPSSPRPRKPVHAIAPLLAICLAPLIATAPAQAQTQPTTNVTATSETAPLNAVAGRYVGERSPNATTPPASAQSQPPAPVATPTIPLTFEQTIAAAVLKRLKEGRGALTKTETNALVAHYETQNPTLLWVTSDGLVEAANQTIAELKNADAFALNPSAYKTPSLKSSPPTNELLAAAELTLSQSVLRYARHAKGGRIRVGQVGSQLTQTPHVTPPAKVLTLLQSATDPAKALRDMHPTHPQFKMLREKLLELTGRSPTSKKAAKIPQGPTLRKGMTHDHVALLRTRLNVPATGGDANVFDDKLEAAVNAFQKKNGTTADGIVGPGTRRALNGRTSTGLVKKIQINMERWRWLPDNMDDQAGLHVWVNIPGLRVRVIKDQKVVFSQKAIVGKLTHKTPVFSDSMEWIEIHPTWFVPNSIKVNDILPSLRRKTSTVMQRYNLKVNCGALGSNYKTIDWNKIDISKCSFTQPAGGKSVLGNFKFKFPNRHSVYLHDTHKRHLFNGDQRTYSHGCVRVKKPRHLAAILLENDHGMTPEQLDRIVDGPKNLRTEKLKSPVPIHITYFTALFDDEGNFKTRPDYYGHDPRLKAALSGRAVTSHQTTAPKKATTKKSSNKKAKKQQAGWWQNLF